LARTDTLLTVPLPLLRITTLIAVALSLTRGCPSRTWTGDTESMDKSTASLEVVLMLTILSFMFVSDPLAFTLAMFVIVPVAVALTTIVI
jgi:hypothetical protein